MSSDAPRFNKMPGMSISSLKKHTALIPLFVAIGAGMIGCGFYCLRLATRNPDVSWFPRI
ncbi:hypothetical protein WDU94_013946 [Cyamophila willieti]